HSDANDKNGADACAPRLSAVEGSVHSRAPITRRCRTRFLPEHARLIKLFPQILKQPAAMRYQFGSEFYSGLLHFAIWQKPDQRFIMKIDNLDAIAPRIAKIASKR